jgi:hypothetical protein
MEIFLTVAVSILIVVFASIVARTMIINGKNYHRTVQGSVFNEVKTLAALSELGPKFIYLEDFEFHANKTGDDCYLRIEKLVGGEDIGISFRGFKFAEVLDLFYKWYERNRDDISRAIEMASSSGPHKRLKDLK